MKFMTLTAALFASTCVSALATPAQAEFRQFNVPSGTLKAALDTFGRQAGRPIIYKAEDVRDISSTGYRGSDTPERALATILKGTGFGIRGGEAGAIAIVRVSPRQPASVGTGPEQAVETSQGNEDIIVTAQKRAENIQDVPLAVTVVTGQQLETANVREFTELSKISPSLTIRPADAAQNASINIRGIGTFAFGVGVESAVAIQIDDVPLAFQARAFTDLSDIERIEVLRGPQSTLYGKNASAGLINIVTRAPGRKFAARATVSATNDKEYIGQLSASGPVNDTIRVGFGVSYRNFDGNVKNLVSGDTVNGTENISVRGRAIWDATPNLSFDANINYAKVDSDPVYTYRVLSPNARLRGNAALTPAVIMPGITPGRDNLQVTLDDQPVYRSTAFSQSLRGTWNLPGDFTLVSITAWDKYESQDAIDSDRTQSTVNRNFANGVFDNNTFTQELRLLSPGTGPLRYTAGFFYANADQRRSYKRGPAFSLAEWNATAGSQQLAVFGQADWTFLPRTTLTLGLRGQREKIDYTFNDLRTAPVSRFAGNSSDGVVTYRVGLKHDVSDDLMIFASHARGHKGQAYDLSTGFNQIRANLGPIRAEQSDSFEGGFRAQLFHRRLTLNGTVFHTDYRNLQIQSVEDILGVPTFRLTNAGKSRTRGVEADFIARPFDGLNLYGGIAYTDAKFIENRTATCYPGQTVAQGCSGNPTRQDLSGARFGVPMWRSNVGADLTVPTGGDLQALFGGAYTWQSRTPSSDPSTPIAAYGLLNLNAGIRAGDRGWTVRLFVNNVFDKGYVAAIGNQYSNFGNQPAIDMLPPRDFKRHAGIRLSTEF